LTVNNKVVASMKLFFKLLTALGEENSLEFEPPMKGVVEQMYSLRTIEI